MVHNIWYSSTVYCIWFSSHQFALFRNTVNNPNRGRRRISIQGWRVTTRLVAGNTVFRTFEYNLFLRVCQSTQYMEHSWYQHFYETFRRFGIHTSFFELWSLNPKLNNHNSKYKKYPHMGVKNTEALKSPHTGHFAQKNYSKIPILKVTFFLSCGR